MIVLGSIKLLVTLGPLSEKLDSLNLNLIISNMDITVFLAYCSKNRK